MIAVNTKVIARQDGGKYLLFDLTSGTMTEINSTGHYIWQYLKSGLNEAEIVAKFQVASPQTPLEDLENGVHSFLAMLAGKNYISGFEGEAQPPPYGEGIKSLDNQAIYDLNSMRRVFTPGDALLLSEIPFVAFRKGDIVAYYPDGTDKTGIVHRVIKRTKDTLITMGDNNPAPDWWRVSPADHPKLVTAKVRPDGKEFAVARGRDGWRQFRINRLRYWCFRIVMKIVRTLLPVMFWRKEFTSKYEFGENNAQYYYRRRLVAKKENGNLEFIPPWYILLYKKNKRDL